MRGIRRPNLRDEYCRTDPLRSVFAGMRADLDAIIDGEIARLRASSTAARMPVAKASTPGTSTNPGSSLAPPIRPGLAGDAGSRLDALARRLEGRLDRPRRRAGEPDPPARGGNAVEARNSPPDGRL